jgi:HAE1 family hydrophobic/amphiphilic exporter-1
VFIPILFLGGLIGRLFQEFAATIGIAILVSGFVSLTLTPMLCSRYLKPGSHAGHGHFYEITEAAWQRLLHGYDRSLHFVMRHRLATLMFSFALLGATLWLGAIIPKGFLPSEDQGQLIGTTEAIEGTSYDAIVALQTKVAAIVQQDPNVAGFMSAVGASGRTPTINQGRLFIRLKPQSERKLSADEVAREMVPKLNQVVGIRTYIQNLPVISIGGVVSKSLYQFQLQGTDLDALYQNAGVLLRKLTAIPLLTDVTSDLLIKNPQARIQVDRDRAASLGITADQVETALYNAYGSRQISTIYTPTNQYWVILEVMPEYQRDLPALDQLYIRSASSALVPLSAVARFSTDVGPLSVSHAGQLPAVTVSFNLAPGVSLSQAVTAVQRVADETLPATISTSFAGTAQAFQDAQRGLLGLLLVAILVIYLVLGILYESFVHPLTILSGLPSAGFGALLTLLIFGYDLNVYAFVGLILLVGIVKKNAIMMVDFAVEAERRAHKSAESAIVEACLVRFRPIMMTTMAALLGTLPIALGAGAGAESRRPLGVAVVGGLAFSQLVTLYLTPVIYTYFDHLQQRFGRGRTRPAPVDELDTPVPVGAGVNGTT